MDSPAVQEADEPEKPTQIEHSTPDLSIQSEIESSGSKPGTARSSKWVIQTEAVTQSGILEPEGSTTQDDDEDQWSCSLCDKCKKLIKDVVEFYFVNGKSGNMKLGPWHKIDDLHKLQEQCALCSLVLAQLSELNLGKTLPNLAKLSEDNATMSARSEFSPIGHSHRILFSPARTGSRPDPQSPNSAHSCDGASVAICDDRILAYQSPCTLSSSRTDSHETIEWIGRWLRKCAADVTGEWFQNHGLHGPCRLWCESVGSGRSVPSRLLKIDSSGHNLRLELMDGCAADKCSYVTLSHCWGGQVPARLLRHNLEQMTRHIPFDDLPRTFQDAITVTHRLGFRYLWIDALCIIQDCPEDWRTQSKTMANVYANCSLNISAVASVDSMGGLFRDRDIRHISPIFTRVFGRNILCYREAWDLEVVQSTLTSRAWAMQERFLAPRVVHFGHHQVHWDCLGMSTSESLPEWFLPLQRNEEHDRCKSISDEMRRTNLEPFHCYTYRRWDQKIRTYTGCKLTFPSDRPVAVLGLAHGFAKRLELRQDDCVFGMWKTRFAYELMWRTFTVRSERWSKEGKTVTPSWSWYSVTGQIENKCWKGTAKGRPGGFHNIKPNIVPVIQIHGFSRDGSRSTSEDSKVELSGPLCDVTVVHKKSQHSAITLRGNSYRAEMAVGIDWDDRRPVEIDRITKSKLCLLLGAIQEADDAPESSHYGQIPAFVVAARATQHSSWHSVRDTVRGSDKYMCLLLKPTDVPAHFERVGYIEFCEDSRNDGSIAQWLCTRDILDKAFQSGDLPSHLHEGVDEYGTYKINLV